MGPYFVPATPLGGLELLKRNGIEMDGQRAVIVGASNLIGKPMSLLLSRHWATVTICDLHTKPLAAMTKEADILVSVTGVAHLISADMIKPGATVLDFGFAKLDDQWVGDVDYEAAKEIAGAISPVPGGTGPMTNVMLMRNTLTAAERLGALREQAGEPGCAGQRDPCGSGRCHAAWRRSGSGLTGWHQRGNILDQTQRGTTLGKMPGRPSRVGPHTRQWGEVAC